MAAYNPNGAEAVGTPGPRRGLPLLGRLARPQLLERLLRVRRRRALPPDLLHRGLRPAPQHHPRRLAAEPAAPADHPGADHRPRPADPGGGACDRDPARKRQLMQKQAPSIGRILVAVGFTLSCFGLILFLWLAFGGPIPLKPKSYRVTAYFPEATQLAVESDVRIGGVSVGKVKSTELAPPDQRVNGRDTTEADHRDRARVRPDLRGRAGDPAPEDAARRDLRRADLGHRARRRCRAGGPRRRDQRLRRRGRRRSSRSRRAAPSASARPRTRPRSTRSSTPSTRRPARPSSAGMRQLGGRRRGPRPRPQRRLRQPRPVRHRRLRGAHGAQPPEGSSSRAWCATPAPSSRRSPPARRRSPATIEGSNETFEALAQRRRRSPRSSRSCRPSSARAAPTFIRLDQFQENTHPLIQDLIPVASDLSPTLRSVRQLSPNLKRLFKNLDPLIDASKRGLPALRDILNGLAPVLDNLDPFLANLNPIVRYLNLQRASINDFLAGPSVALSNSLEPVAGQDSARHYLRQLSYQGPESLRSTRSGSTSTAATATCSPASSTAPTRPSAGSSRTSTARTPTTRPAAAAIPTRTRSSRASRSPASTTATRPRRTSRRASSRATGRTRTTRSWILPGLLVHPGRPLPAPVRRPLGRKPDRPIGFPS